MKHHDQNNLNKCLNMILKHKISTCIAIILLFAIPLIAVHILFKWQSNIYWIQSEWDAGDIISYVAGFEAFIGTAILSFLALWQNQQHKQENDNKDKMLLEIENEKIRLSNLPQFLVQTADWRNVVDSSSSISSKPDIVTLDYHKTHGFFINEFGTYWIPYDKIPGIDRKELSKFVAIVNCGNNTAHQVKLSINVFGKTFPDEKVFSVKKDDELYLYIGIDRKIPFQNDLVLTLRFFDCFQNVYEQEFKMENTPEYFRFISFSDVKLISKNQSMQFTIQN